MAEPAKSAAEPSIVTTADGSVGIILPQGAIEEPIGLTIDRLALPPGAPPDGVIPGAIYEFGPAGTQFGVPITVAVKFDPALLPANRSAESLRLARLSEGRWEIVPGSGVDPMTGALRGELDHFSIYAVQAIPRVALTVWRGGITTDGAPAYDIFLVYEDGQGLQHLAEGHWPAWSPDGRLIAFSCRGPRGWTVCTIAPVGTRKEFIYIANVWISGPPHDGPSAWSPDGTKLVIDRAAVISMNADREVLEDNTFVLRPELDFANQLGTVMTPSWSPDGAKITFCSPSGDWDTCRLFEVSLREEGGPYLGLVPFGLTPLTSGSVLWEWSPLWTPDYETIVHAASEPAHSLRVLHVPSGEVSVLLVGTWEDDYPFTLMPSLTPNGKRVVFFWYGPSWDGDRRSGSIWAIDVDGTGLTRIIDGSIISSALGDQAWIVNGVSWEP